jgi:septal ring factor EnvC (AmiA/AmiB activator)
MTDTDIIKALECCSENKTLCSTCLYRKSPVECCSSDLLKDTIALINRQKAEIEILIRKKDTLKDEVAEQQAEIERLKGDLAFREKQLDNLIKEMECDIQ